MPAPAIEFAAGNQGCVAILTSLESALLEVNSFPVGSELDVLQVTCPGFKNGRKNLTKRLVDIIRSVASRYAVTNRTIDCDGASSDSTTDITPRDHLYDETFETTEEALECFNAALDAARGIQDAIVQPNGALGPNPGTLKVGLGYLGKRQGGFLDIEKPQLHFPDYPINNSDSPFVPPYNRDSGTGDLPYDEAKTEHVDRHLQDLFRNNSEHDGERRHPYEEEITTATVEMVSKRFREENVMVYGSPDETPCTWVTTEEELFNVTENLKRVSEIAVDLENHSMRSFQGFTCLLQISTRREDYVIDTLTLRGSVNRALAPIFADETIVKVLHGADQDVQWLERDFGIYVVNMFDTGQAARLLKLPSAALSFLLAKYCDVAGTSKKKFQLADWRQRPLPKDMFEYARSDTHYLLYICDRVRSELSKNDLLTKAWERSAKISRKRHSKPRYVPYMAGHLAARHGLRFDRHQIRLLEALCKWRDATAREEDESLTYVAPLHTLFGIVRARDAARTVPGLMKHGFPMRQVPPLVYKHIEAITRFVSDALDAKLEESGNIEHAAIERLNTNNTKEKSEKERELADKGSEDHAAQRVVSNISRQNGSSNKLRTSAKEGGKRSLEKNRLPLANGRQLSRCSFFDSDSGTDSDAGRHTPGARNLGGKNNTEECIGKSNGTWAEKALEKEVNKDVAERNEDEEKHVARTRGVFDLSDSSEEGEDSENVDRGRRKAAKVAEELEAELAEKAKTLQSGEFETELEARKRESEQFVQKDRESEEEKVTEEKKQEEVISMLESARRKDGDSSRRRKRKATEKVIEAERHDAFDYSSAMKEMKNRKDRKRRERSFDPMEGLRGQRDMTGRSKAKRRRRGRGKSMSFASKK